MKVISPSHEILFMPEGAQILRLIEMAGRTCYKSEDLIKQDSAAGFIARIIASGHHSVIEHANITVRFVCDRGVTHELVRHRLAAYSQESTRYANYAKEKFGKEITVIRPLFWPADSPEYRLWQEAMQRAEQAYMRLLEMGATPQEARSVLPNSLKTEIVMTANLREWRHVIGLRASAASHPQIREIMLPLLADFHARLPVIFNDLYEKYQEDIARQAEHRKTLTS
jgi:thymidylate synthase (FAD)